MPPYDYRAQRLAKKIEAGAQFIQTQYCYDVPRFVEYMRQVRDLGLDQAVYILAGVGPLRSYRTAQFLRNKVPGVVIPDAIMERMRKTPKDKQREEGTKICIEIIQTNQRNPGIIGCAPDGLPAGRTGGRYCDAVRFITPPEPGSKKSYSGVIMSIFIGCDLGGTNIKAGLVNVDTGKVLLSRSTPTLARDLHDAVMKRMADLIDELIEESGLPREDVQGVGVSAPGMLDEELGVVEFLPNLQGNWRGVPLRDTLQEYLNLPVVILNDVKAITIGEFSFGAAKHVESMICFAIGTGIGGGLVIDGKLVRGVNGFAGELGHQTIDPNGPLCGCGNYGCLESFASGPAIASMGEKVVRQGLTTKIGDLVDYDLNKITPEVIARAAEMGDEIALEIWQKAGEYLGIGVANMICAVAPQMIVITGGVAAAGELLLKPVRETICKRVQFMPNEDFEVVLGSLGNDAGILGMARMAALKQEVQ